MAIKVVTIDFWNTIFDSSNGQMRNYIRNQEIRKAMKKIGFEPTDHQINDAVRAAWGHFNRLWTEEMRTPMPIESVEFIWNYFSLSYDKEIINEVVRSFETAILKYPPNLVQDASYAISKLSEDFQIGLISDTGFTPGSVLQELMKQKNIFQYFKSFSFSDETGVSKPHPKAYEKVLSELNCNPEEALHIGDIEDTDIKGAKNLGMKAVLFLGDPTANQTTHTKQHSKADAIAHSWNEALIYIRRLSTQIF